ncbi:MAG: hypothetical protein V4482_03675 [Pseudomonadota bacterium]
MIKYIVITMLGMVSLYANAMKSDADHQKKETYIAELAFEDMKKMEHGEAIRWLITPKLRLTKDDIQALEKGSLLDVDGVRTIATLTAIEWKGDLSLLSSGPDLLMEKVLYDPEKNAYIVKYEYPKDNANHGKGMSVQLSNIKVKEQEEAIGKFLIDLIAHPGIPHKSTSSQAVQIVQPIATRAPAQVITQAPAQIIVQSAPPPQTVIVEEVGRPYGPYYGPYLYPEVVVGGWGHGEWGHHHGWRR